VQWEITDFTYFTDSRTAMANAADERDCPARSGPNAKNSVIVR
jgi:hypothetical protein